MTSLISTLKNIAKKIIITFKKILGIDEKTLFEKKPVSFWENVAERHSVIYGLSKHDFGVIGNLVEKINAKKVLDFGCGSGRLFPLYLQKNVEEIVGIDISPKTLKIAHERYPSDKIKTFSKSVFEIDFPEKYFDFVNCTRVLQHMKEGEIDEVISRLCFLSNNIYVNEMSDSDLRTIYYIHKYDYPSLFIKHGYIVDETGMIDDQKHFLFVKK